MACPFGIIILGILHCCCYKGHWEEKEIFSRTTTPSNAWKFLNNEFVKTFTQGKDIKTCYYIHWSALKGFPPFRKTVSPHMKNYKNISCVFEMANQLLEGHSLY